MNLSKLRHIDNENCVLKWNYLREFTMEIRCYFLKLCVVKAAKTKYLFLYFFRNYLLHLYLKMLKTSLLCPYISYDLWHVTYEISKGFKWKKMKEWLIFVMKPYLQWLKTSLKIFWNEIESSNSNWINGFNTNAIIF